MQDCGCEGRSGGSGKTERPARLAYCRGPRGNDSCHLPVQKILWSSRVRPCGSPGPHTTYTHTNDSPGAKEKRRQNSPPAVSTCVGLWGLRGLPGKRESGAAPPQSSPRGAGASHPQEPQDSLQLRNHLLSVIQSTLIASVCDLHPERQGPGPCGNRRRFVLRSLVACPVHAEWRAEKRRRSRVAVADGAV